MNLWCDSCGKVHRFAPSAVERIVYTLQALYAMEETCERWREGEPEPLCLIEALSDSASAEAYADHADALRDRRLASERARKPQLPGRRS